MTGTVRRVLVGLVVGMAGVVLIGVVATMGVAASRSAGCAALPAGGWVTVGATEDPTSGQAPTFSDHGGMSFAELLTAGANAGLWQQDLASVLGLPNRPLFGMPMETPILIRLPGSTKVFTIYKNDVGSGQPSPHYKIDLHPGIVAALDWRSNQNVEVAPAGSSPLAGQCVAVGPATVQQLVAMAQAAIGAPYSQGNHASAFTDSTAQMRTLGTDCSGFVSWLMGPRGLAIWSTPQTTPTIPTAPHLQPGAGQYITIYNNPLPGNAGHVWIRLLGLYFASEGGIGVHQLAAAEVKSYLVSGVYVPWHPAGD